MIYKESADITPKRTTPQKSENFFYWAIQGNPTPKARPRRGKYGNFYTPAKTKKYEEFVKLTFMSNYAPVLDKTHEWELDIEIQYKGRRMDGDNVLCCHRHTHDVSAYALEESILGRGLEIRAGDSDEHALPESDLLLESDVLGQSNVVPVVGL